MLANVSQCFATHIKAADIQVERDPNDPKKYSFTLYVYFEESRVGSSGVPTDNATLDFGDNSTQTTTRIKPLEVTSPGVVKGTYIFSHFYEFNGKYFVGYTENNRVDDVLNMYSSVNTPLYIESMITIDPFIDINDSPILTIPPIDNANSGQLYAYNTGAVDPNGDSLSYEMIPTQQAQGKEVEGYVSPSDSKFNGTALAGGLATFKINSKTGDITWDTPGQVGIYNIAIKVTEYRNGTRIGYVVRDMQIIVKDGKNKPPKLKLPNDTCVVADGSKLIFNVITADPDNNSVATDVFGAQVLFGKAILNTTLIYPVPPSTTQLNWQPTCGDAQDQPYTFNFMAQDYPLSGVGDKMYDFKTLSIKLNAPKPTNLKVVELNKAAKLTWDPYSITCPVAKFQDTVQAVVEIYRQECDSLFENNDCNQGRSPYLSGELIAKVPITYSAYMDDNDGKGLKIGTYYYYTIKPRSNDQKLGGGAGIAATPVGIILSPKVPLIKQITVMTTGVNGTLKVSWMKPFDTLGLNPPFVYQLMRASGLKGTQYREVTNITSNKLLDTFFVDQVNTVDSNYLYVLKFSANGVLVGQTEPSSNILLTTKASNAKVNLDIHHKPTFIINHYNIYNANTKALIKRVTPLSDTLTKVEITNLTNCDTVCFEVESVGRYCIDTGDDSISNFSQKICEVPRMGSKPVVQIGVKESICGKYTCAESFPEPPYSNVIFWKKPLTTPCDQPNGYNVYYAANDKATYSIIGTTSDCTFVHSDLLTFSGCYYVKTLNSNEEEGDASNTVCQDICPCFELPNIVTPNNDELNELFVPLFPPRFVESVKFSVFNRWGGKVFESSDIFDINIHWNAKSLSDGIYYYHADVTFSNRAKESDRNKTYKGWVQVAR